MARPRKPTSVKRLTGTAEPLREVCDLQGNPCKQGVKPPEHFTERQRATWHELFYLLAEHNIMTALDVHSLSALTLAYDGVMHTEQPSVADVKALMGLMGKMGLVAGDRRNIPVVPRKQKSELAELRSRRAKALQPH